MLFVITHQWFSIYLQREIRYFNAVHIEMSKEEKVTVINMMYG